MSVRDQGGRGAGPRNGRVNLSDVNKALDLVRHIADHGSEQALVGQIGALDRILEHFRWQQDHDLRRMIAEGELERRFLAKLGTPQQAIATLEEMTAKLRASLSMPAELPEGNDDGT